MTVEQLPTSLKNPNTMNELTIMSMLQDQGVPIDVLDVDAENNGDFYTGTIEWHDRNNIALRITLDEGTKDEADYIKVFNKRYVRDWTYKALDLKAS